MGLFKENQVADGAHGTKAAFLSQKANSQANHQRNSQRRIHGSGPLKAVEKQSALVLTGDWWAEEHHDQKAQHNQRHDPTCRGMGFVAAS